ncbi:hypothetical protein DTW90_34125 [Neorhizobium sp. P12A]|uniref:hypothetical protein n=1 Tax=Neorhizobium sp. P12A TaxID=2268027 RepID=UPI0011ED6F26|nr:hypothetical protein [Neorhizobium sp. P12A]KAA0686474.1 hypothetical protein DTW90_34125 [Neorhizobium sp. P12A]
MFRRYVRDYDLPLLGGDMDMCQKVFDIVCAQLHIEAGSELESRLAANIIQFYKQGFPSEPQLMIMARTVAIS